MIALNKPRFRIPMLVTAHVAIGTALAIVAARNRTVTWSLGVELAYNSFVATELLLVGLWSGLATISLGTRLLVFSLGIAWLVILSTAPSSQLPEGHEVVELGIVLVGCVAGIAVPLALYRRIGGRIEWRPKWSPSLMLRDRQFTIKSLIVLTTLLGILLASGRAISRAGGDRLGIVIVVCTFALVAVLETWLLVWANLGMGNIRIRLPIAIAGTASVGLIPPYFDSGGMSVQYAFWPVLTTSVAVLVIISLLIIRSCGYRLVRVASRETTDEGMADGALRDGQSGTTITAT